MGVIYNARVKLAASALSKMGVALIIAGVGTAVAAVYRETALPNATLFPAALTLVLIGFALPAVAQLLLGRLKDV